MRWLSIILVALAAICKAFSDTLAHHFGRSIFSTSNPKFWNPDESWKSAKMIFAYRLDGWHLFNSGLILFFILAIVYYMGFAYKWTRKPLLAKLIDFTVLSIVFVVVFNIFYNHILLT